MSDRRAPLMILRVLAIVALALGAIFDIGLMPARDAAGQQILVLCSGQVPMQMLLDPVTGKLRPVEPSNRGRVSCDWAAAQSCGLMPIAVTSPQILEASYETAFSGEIVWRSTRKVTAVWARGPPPLV